MFLANVIDFVKSHVKTMILDNDIIMNCINKLTELGWLTIIEMDNDKDGKVCKLLRMNREILISSVMQLIENLGDE